MADETTPIGIRFVQAFDPHGDAEADLRRARVWHLAMRDDRDVPFAQKLADAREYLRLHTH
jgi:hypothetical protein